MMGAMRVLGRIAVGMVHSVQNCICSWRQIRTTLTYPGKHIEKPFPEFCHGKHLMGCVSVKEETLAKK